jgi:uncharacterized protein (TIGR01777 family)
MRIAVTGSTGLIGSHLVPALRADGHDVVRLVRGRAAAADEVPWDPSARTVDLAGLAGTEAVVHLAGAPVAGQRWSEEYKRVIRDSRVDGTTAIAQACAQLDPRPRVLVSGSAVGWYGDTGDTAVDETMQAGTGFLPDVVRAWEAATAPAEDAGVRVVHARTGVVIAAEGGLLAQPVPLPGGLRVSLLQIFRAGLGGRTGNGRQWLSWISIADEVAALRWLLARDDLSGPVNLTGPRPVSNAQFTAALAKALHRPAIVPVPAIALRAVTGEFAQEALGSQRVLPRRLERSGFAFNHATVDDALAAALRTA